MRIPVNLSSEPFRRDRPLVAASIAVGVLLTAALAMLTSLAVLERGAAAQTRRDIARVQAELRSLNLEQGRLEEAL